MEAVLRPENSRNVRCNQAGDWWTSPDGAIVATSLPMRDERSEFAVLVHELVEAFLCKYVGISDEEVVNFDSMFELERENGDHDATDENGDDERAPYNTQHFVATQIEKILCIALKLPWAEHEESVAASVETLRGLN